MSNDKSAIKEIVDTAVGVWIGNALGKMGKGTRRRLFRWRRALAPLWFGFFIWLACVLWRWQIPQWWPVLLVVPIGGALLAWFGPKISERWSRVIMTMVPSGLDKGKDGVLDRPIERLYFGLLTGYLGVYMLIRVIDGPSSTTGWLWQIGELAFGGSWWYHRRVRVAGRADKYARKWHRFRERDTCPPRLGTLVGSKVLGARAQGLTSELHIRLAEALTPDSLLGVGESLASFYNMRPGSVHITPDKDKARQVYIVFVPSDPWKGKIPHPVFLDRTIVPGEMSLAGMGKRLVMGLQANGDPLDFELQHLLLCGETGSGKSGWIHSLMTWLVPCNDVVLLGIDMGSNSTLGPWRRTFALDLATDATEGLHILEKVFAVIQYRERQLGLASEDDDDAADSYEPTPGNPWIVLVIDEFPDLLADAKGIKIPDEEGGGTLLNKLLLVLGRIAKKARKTGVRLAFASQNGTKADVGSKEMMGQLTATVGLRLREEQSRNLWGPEDVRRGWKSSDLNKPEFRLKDSDHDDPRTAHAKGFWVENRDRRKLVHQMCDPKTNRRSVYLEPPAWSLLMGETYIEEVEDEVSETGPELAVLNYLRDEAPEGATAKKISEVLTRAREATGGGGPGTSEPTIYRHLQALESRLLVERNSGGVKGLWRAIIIEGGPVPTQRTEGDAPVQIASIQGEQAP